MPVIQGSSMKDAFVTKGRDESGVSVAGADGTNTAMRADFITAAPTSGAWILPVVGMSNAPGKFQAGGAPQWSTGSFGYQKPASKGGHVHKGVDIYADRGTGVVAPVTGVVSSMGKSDVSGNYVKVKGDDGYEYYYAHLDSIHSGISRGMRVGAGAYLGGVGNTGNASGTSAHLHFEIRKGGKTVSPNEFIKSGQIQDTTPMSAIAGLNTVDEVQAYIDEQVAAAQVMAQGAQGFDPATWGQPSGVTAEEERLDQVAGSQSMLGQVLNGMSSTLAGGQREQMVYTSSALDAGTGVDRDGVVPSAASQQIEVEDEEGEMA